MLLGLTVFSSLLAVALSADKTDGKCVIPSDLRGTWYQASLIEQLTITEDSVLPRGKCVHSEVKKVDKTTNHVHEETLGPDATYHSFILERQLANGSLCYSCLDFGDSGKDADEYEMFQDFDALYNCYPKPEPSSKLCQNMNALTVYRFKLTEKCPFAAAASDFEFFQTVYTVLCPGGKSQVEPSSDGKRLNLKLVDCDNATNVQNVELECVATVKTMLDKSFHLIGKIPSVYRCYEFNMKYRYITDNMKDEDCAKLYKLMTKT